MTKKSVLLVGDSRSADTILARRTLNNLILDYVPDLLQAKEKLQQHATDPYDVCCVDQELPQGEDAFTFVETLRQLSPQSLSIVFTFPDVQGASADSQRAGLHAYEVGAQFYLSKPINRRELERLLDRFQNERTVTHEQELVEFVNDAYQARSLGQVAQLIVQYGLRLGFRRARLYDFQQNERFGEFVGVAQSGNQGLPADFRSVRDQLNADDPGYISRILQTKEPSFFPGREPGELEFDRAYEPSGFKPPRGPWVELPLGVDDAIWGTLTLDYDQDDPPVALCSLRPMLSLFGKLAYVAIERAQKRESLFKKRAEPLLKSIPRDLNREETVAAVLHRLQELFSDLDVRPFVLTYDEKENVLRFTDRSLKTFYQIDVETEKERREVKLSEPSIVSKVAKRSLQNGTPEHENILDVSAPGTGYLKLIENTRSELCRTLMSQRKLLGVIALESSIQNAFTETDVSVLEMVAALVTDAIERADQNEAGRVQWIRFSCQECMRLLFPGKGDIPADMCEADQLLLSLFPTARQLVVEALDVLDQPEDYSLPPRAFSMVRLKVRDVTDSDIFVKIGLPKRIASEFEKYTAYIKKLQDIYQDSFAEFCKLELGNSLSAAIYRFSQTPIGELTPFDSYFANRDPATIIRSLDGFFLDIWKEYYEDRTDDDRSLFSQYSQVWKESRWEQRLRDYANQNTLDNQGVLRGFDIPDPVAWVIEKVGIKNTRASDQSKVSGTMQAVTHGDLRSGTLFVNTRGTNDIRIGDYKRLGIGPVLQDFAELEVDILLRLTCAGSDDLHLVHALMDSLVQTFTIKEPIDVNREHKDVVKTRSVLSALRVRAQVLTGVTDIDQYLWGLLFNTVYIALMSLESSRDVQLRRRAVLFGGLLCKRLDQLLLSTPVEQAQANQPLGAGSLQEPIPPQSELLDTARPDAGEPLLQPQLLRLSENADDLAALVEIITSLATSSPLSVDEYFRDLLRAAALPQTYVSERAGWTADAGANARTLVIWAESKGQNPVAPKYTTLGSIVRVLYSRVGSDSQSVLSRLVHTYGLYLDEMLLANLDTT